MKRAEGEGHMTKDESASRAKEAYVDPDAIANKEFRPAHDGYEPNQVRAYLVAVAEVVRGLEAERRKLVDELTKIRERSRGDGGDSANLVDSFAEEVRRVMLEAREAAERITSRAKDEAGGIIEEARRRAEEIVAAAERRSSAADEEVRRVVEMRLSRARERAREIVSEAEKAREEILADLSRRYRSAVRVLEQVEAAHGELQASLIAIRDQVSELVANTESAGERARVAADEVPEREGPTLEDLEAALSLLAVQKAGGSPPADAPGEQAPAAAATGDEGGDNDREVIAALFARIRADSEVPGNATEGPATSPDASSKKPGLSRGS
ncbi:MAG: hypothetical protein KatS3mg008_1009 [Acidimicrobiales bacterium]|nr:MAG: hypothetical protein KatS3mg008_1009 [Acidimicrobiales bacterium]